MSRDLKEMFLKGLMNAMSNDDEDDDNVKIIKTIPVRKEWKVAHDRLQKASDDLHEKIEAVDVAKRNHKLLYSNFWSTVRIDAGLENADQLNYNHETEEIEICEEIKKED